MDLMEGTKWVILVKWSTITNKSNLPTRGKLVMKYMEINAKCGLELVVDGENHIVDDVLQFWIEHK